MKCQAALKAFQKPGRDAALHQAVTPQWNLSELTATLRTKDLTDLQKSDYSCFSLIVFFLLFPPSSKEQVCLVILFYLDLHELMKIMEEENIHAHTRAQTHTHVHAHTRACTADHGQQNGVFFILRFVCTKYFMIKSTVYQNKELYPAGRLTAVHRLYPGPKSERHCWSMEYWKPGSGGWAGQSWLKGSSRRQS